MIAVSLRPNSTLRAGPGIALGLSVTWFSVLVLIPLAAIVGRTAAGGWAPFWRALSNEQTAAAIRLTVGMALAVTLVNVVIGTLIAWVLVRDQFRGKRIVEVVIDIPFALPTIVAGLVLLSLYGRSSPIGVDVANTRAAVFLAFAFVTLPFVVRTVRELVPVLAELGTDQEQAAHSLGASGAQTFRRITLPAVRWALIYGVILSLARSLGEFGAVKVVSGNVVGRTQTATLVVEQRYQEFAQNQSYAIAFLLAAVSVACITVVTLLRKDHP